MSVPQKSTVLVVGGGPAGSYAACVLAREGVDVVVLEADKFPRYHIGESMLASMRYFLRFIELEEAFDKHGFEKKFGATFKITDKKPSFTDFSVSLGQGGYSWNVIRSESDEMIFRYAEQCGAKVFDATKVDEITFEPYDQDGFDRKIRLANPGRPVSATWSRKDGTTGSISFDYIIDASGRNGIISTKYLKNRRLNEALKNIANWTYWKGAKRFNVGEKNENSPFFEALSDGSGWVWAIPLHNGTLSCGIVARQDIFFAKKKETGLSGSAFYKEYLKMAPRIHDMVQGAEMLSDVKQASDWSYSAGAYAGPHFRLAGDAGCFIDPYFSSGVHLALTSGLSAAATIQASIRGQCSELTAAKWHTTKVNEGYTRFLLVVMTVLRQLRSKGTAIIGEEKDEGYDKAFSFIQPVIQGTADTDVENKSIQKKAAEGVEFALGTMKEDRKANERAILDKVQGARDRAEEMEKLTEEELATLGAIVQRNVQITNNAQNINSVANDVIDGLSIDLVRGNLGLVKKYSDDMKIQTGKASFMTSEQMDALELNRTISVEAS